MVIDPHELKTIASMMPPLLLTIVGIEALDFLYVAEHICGRDVSYYFNELGLLFFFIAGCIAIGHHDVAVRAKQYFEASAVSCMIVALVFTFNLGMNVDEHVRTRCCKPEYDYSIVF